LALPRDSKSTEGARALLFDRLVDAKPAEPVEQQPLRVLTVDQVRDSVQRELARLLNTRSPTAPEELERKEWTVLDWGLPDYSGWYTRSAPSRDRLARLVEQTIRAFEPRMIDPRVTVEEQSDNDRALTVFIDGTIRVGTLLEPVSFPLALEGGTSQR
jgi:type VI secretion system protein ImpF